MLFIEYSKCSTCQKAEKFLKEGNVCFEKRSIVSETPSFSELKAWIKKYSIDINKMFNTSGIKYRELQLKDKLLFMSDDEKIKLLSSDGMLIKRPLLVGDSFMIIGFKKSLYQKLVEGYE